MNQPEGIVVYQKEEQTSVQTESVWRSEASLGIGSNEIGFQFYNKAAEELTSINFGNLLHKIQVSNVEQISF